MSEFGCTGPEIWLLLAGLAPRWQPPPDGSPAPSREGRVAVWLTPGAWLVELRLLMTPPASENVTPSIQPALRGPFRFPLWAGEPKQPPLPPQIGKSTMCHLKSETSTTTTNRREIDKVPDLRASPVRSQILVDLTASEGNGGALAVECGTRTEPHAKCAATRGGAPYGFCRELPHRAVDFECGLCAAGAGGRGCAQSGCRHCPL